MFFANVIRAVVVAFFSLSASLAAASLTVGSIAPYVTLKGKDGGRVDGTAWASKELRGKVHTLFYVDPDEQELNAHVEQALKKENFPRDRYASVAIVNMKATWIPNFLIAKRLKKKQEEFTQTTFVKDQTKALVKAWGLQDDSYHVLMFDKQGKLAFSKGVKMDEGDISNLISIIRRHIDL